MGFRSWIAIILLASCASPERLFERAVKKDPHILEKLRQPAQVVYLRSKKDSTVYDTMFIEQTINYEPKTRKEKRIDYKFRKAELERFKYENDTLKAYVKFLQQKTKTEKQEEKKLAEETKQLRKENRNNTLQWILNNWWIILIGLILWRINIFKWLKETFGQRQSKQKQQD